MSTSSLCNQYDQDAAIGSSSHFPKNRHPIRGPSGWEKVIYLPMEIFHHSISLTSYIYGNREKENESKRKKDFLILQSVASPSLPLGKHHQNNSNRDAESKIQNSMRRRKRRRRRGSVP